MKSLSSLSVIFSLMSIALHCQASAYPALPQGPTSQFTQSTQHKSDSLLRYVGTYELAPGQQLTVSVVANILYILPPNETEKASIKAVGHNQFVVVGEQAHLVFTQDPTGQITAVVIHFGNGASTTGKKLG